MQMGKKKIKSRQNKREFLYKFIIIIPGEIKLIQMFATKAT